MNINIHQNIKKFIFKIYRHLRKDCLIKTNNKLTIFQVHILSFIKENKLSSVKIISQTFGISLPAATITIDKLIKDKLIKKQPSIKDRRINYLFLTKKGEKTILKIEEKKDETIEKLLHKLNNIEKQTLLNLLIKITKN